MARRSFGAYMVLGILDGSFDLFVLNAILYRLAHGSVNDQKDDENVECTHIEIKAFPNSKLVQTVCMLIMYLPIQFWRDDIRPGNSPDLNIAEPFLMNVDNIRIFNSCDKLSFE